MYASKTVKYLCSSFSDLSNGFKCHVNEFKLQKA